MLATPSIRVPADGTEPETDDGTADIHVSRTWNHQYYGAKVGIETPAPWEDDGKANETMKELDYDQTHRQWNEQAEEWEADLENLNCIVQHFNNAGYDVTVSVKVARKFESDGNTFLPDKR